MAAADASAINVEGALLGMGNPLLDILATVGTEVIEKYGLKPGDVVMAEAGDKYQPIFPEIAKAEGSKQIAGGATLNVVRVCQWMLQKEKATSFVGCVGKDEFGDKLKAACDEAGVTSKLLVDEATPTGTCACSITGKERTLVTNLGAANNYKLDHFKGAEQQAILEKAKVVYSAGFHMTVCPDGMELAAKHCTATGKSYCLNLSAPFLMEAPPFKAILEKLLPNVDYLFGNETEAACFAKVWGWEETAIPDIAKKLAALPKEGKARTVVITQGASPTVVCINGEVTEHPILKLSAEQLVDTNGAGDAYVGGFLSGLVQDKPVAYCCQAGAYSASVIVQQSGCTFPAKPNFTGAA